MTKLSKSEEARSSVPPDPKIWGGTCLRASMASPPMSLDPGVPLVTPRPCPFSLMSPPVSLAGEIKMFKKIPWNDVIVSPCIHTYIKDRIFVRTAAAFSSRICRDKRPSVSDCSRRGWARCRRCASAVRTELMINTTLAHRQAIRQILLFDVSRDFLPCSRAGPAPQRPSWVGRGSSFITPTGGHKCERRGLNGTRRLRHQPIPSPNTGWLRCTAGVTGVSSNYSIVLVPLIPNSIVEAQTRIPKKVTDRLRHPRNFGTLTSRTVTFQNSFIPFSSIPYL